MSDTVTTTKTAETRSMPSAPATRSIAGSIAPLFSFISLVAVAGLGYLYWQQQVSINRLQAELQTLAASGSQAASRQEQQALALQLSELATQQQSLEKAASDTLNAQQQFISTQQQMQLGMQQQLQMTSLSLAEQATQLAMLNDELTNVSALISVNGQQTLRPQVLAEVLSMLRIAELRLQLTQDVNVAATLLRSADALLARLSEPGVAALRSQLANDLVALQAVNTVEGTALYQQLNTAIAQQQALGVESKTAPTHLEVPALTPPFVAINTTWWETVKNFVSRYFVVTQRDQVITPLLSPEQTWLVHKSVELQLRQAQAAVLNGEQALFQTTLQAAASAIEASLQGEGKAALLTELQTLQTLTLRPPLPSLVARISSVELLQQTVPTAAGALP
jgi:uroporphyrin-III C-methyltransferase